jgi:hypothetical protein
MLNEPNRGPRPGSRGLRLLLVVVLGVAIGTGVYVSADSQKNAQLAARRAAQQAGAASLEAADQTPPSYLMQGAAAEIVAAEITPTNTQVGDMLDITITVTNTSDAPLQTMGPLPDFTYVQGQTYFTQQYASDPGKWRVAIGTAGLDSTELPYRWGLGGDLAPGATTTVTGHIKVTQDFKTTNFWAALVNEPSTVVHTGVGMTLVTSLLQNVAIVAVDVANVHSSPTILEPRRTEIPSR